LHQVQLLQRQDGQGYDYGMSPPERTRLFSHITKTRFLHIEDALANGRKLRFFVGAFERGHGANTTAYAFLDIDDARVIMNDLAWGRAVNIVDYKGGRDSNEAVISRVLKIERKDDKVWVEVQNGVGEELFEGAIKPQGKPFAEVSIPLTIHEGRKMAYACLAYLQAWEVVRLLRGEDPNVTSVNYYRQTGQLR
jgi:hypothetical protein